MSGLFRYLLDAIGLGGDAQAFRREGGPVTFRLLQEESVRQELGLNIEQIGMIGKYTREARAQHRKTYVKVRTLEPEKRRAEGQKLMQAVAEDALRAIKKAGILSGPQQQRLQQLAWQNRGVSVFTDPAVIRALALSEGQQHAILNVIDETKVKLRELFHGEEDPDLPGEPGDGPRQRPAAPPTDEQKEAAAALRKGAMDKALAALSEEQRKRWEELKGAPFEFNFEGGPRGGEI